MERNSTVIRAKLWLTNSDRKKYHLVMRSPKQQIKGKIMSYDEEQKRLQDLISRCEDKLFELHLQAKSPVFAWLYLIGDRIIENFSHQEIIELAITANKAEIVKLNIPGKFKLGLILIWGNATLAACNINPEKNRVVLCTAFDNQQLSDGKCFP